MDTAYARAWLKKRSWHVTDLRVKAIMTGVDLTALGCDTWSDGGPCQTCVKAGLEDRKRMVS
jgi:hypothetical protein